MEDKRKHLDYIQAVIARMASNSFLLKRWSIVVLAAVTYLASKAEDLALAVSAVMLPVVLFACFDLYFLRLERLFRALYDDVRKKKADAIDYSMDVDAFRSKETWRSVAARPIFCMFHVGLAIVWVTGLCLAISVVNDR